MEKRIRYFSHFAALFCTTLLSVVLLLASPVVSIAKHHDHRADTLSLSIAIDTDPVTIFLNHWSTNVDVLFYDVGLSAGRSNNLAAAKVGDDSICGTVDDSTFTDRTAVDAVPDIGPSTIIAIENYSKTRWDSGAIPVHHRIIHFINGPFATLKSLDKDVGLSQAVAQRILSRRDGPDGVVGTPDDNPFDSVFEIDAIPTIGLSIIRTLQNFSAAWRKPGVIDIYDAIVDFKKGDMRLRGTLQVPPTLPLDTVKMEAGIFLTLAGVRLSEAIELRGPRESIIWKYHRRHFAKRDHGGGNDEKDRGRKKRIDKEDEHTGHRDKNDNPPIIVKSFKILWSDALRGNGEWQTHSPRPTLFELKVEFDRVLFPMGDATFPRVMEVAIRLGCDPLIVDDMIGDDESWHNIENGKWQYRKDASPPFDEDGDFDGISDRNEDKNGNGVVDSGETNPNDPDTDGDGLYDGDEVLVFQTDPRNMDSDFDGIADGEELVAGGDGYITNPLNTDVDGDGLRDGFEVSNGYTPLSKDSDGNGILDAHEDPDGDGRPNSQEQANNTQPFEVDKDGDGPPFILFVKEFRPGPGGDIE